MAYRLSLNKKNFLVAIHVLSVMTWFGATLTLIILSFYMLNAENGDQLFYTLSSMRLIDENLVKFPALASLITGILLSVWTHWRLAKHYWMLIKFIMTIVLILIGIFFMDNWLSYIYSASEALGFSALEDQKFEQTSLYLISLAIFNGSALAFMTFITYFKPFGKVKKKAKT